MADVVSASSFGYSTGALSKWAADVEDPLVTAIGDFPKRGIAVCSESPRVTCRLILFLAECCPSLDLEISMFNP